MALYDNIKALCDSHKIRPAALERALGLSNGYIGSMRKKTPSSVNLQKIADYFDVPVEYLLSGVMPEQSNEAIIASVIKQAYKEDSPTRLQLIKRIYTLTPDECLKLLDLIPVVFGK